MSISEKVFYLDYDSWLAMKKMIVNNTKRNSQHALVYNGAKILYFYSTIVNVYDLERTICDVIKYRKNMDRSVVNNALRTYAESTKAKRYKLSIYAKKMGISKLVSEVMEVLFFEM